MTKTHSKFSASGASRWMKCTASVRLESTQPKTESKYAAEGTQAHSFLESHLFSLEAGHPDIEFMDAFFLYRDYVFSLMRQTKSFTIEIEKKLSLSFIDPEMFGTADLIFTDHEVSTVHVIDFKFGKTKVNPDTPQLKFYAVGAVYKKDIERVILTVVQPRASVKNKIRSFETNKKELSVFAGEMSRTVKEIKKGIESFSVGEHCYFCRAKTVCKEYRKTITSSAVDDFEGV